VKRQRVFRIDVATRARCGAPGRVIAGIEEQTVIDRILVY